MKELAVVNYKLRLTPGDKLWDDLTSDPRTKTYDPIAHVEKFAQLEYDAKFAERQGASSSRGESSFKHHKEGVEECKG